MQPKDLEKIPLQVEKLFYDLQNRVMSDVVRRIEKTGSITSTADYQLEKMKIFGNTSEYLESETKRILTASDAEVWKLYDEVVEKDYTRNKSLYDQVNAKFIPYEENELMQSWTKAIIGQTQNNIRNITKSMGFSLDYGAKKVFTPFSEYYQKYLDRACMDIVTGSFSYNTVLRRVVKEMTGSGIRMADYASGYSTRATVASRRAVMTGVNQLSGRINDMNAEKLGTDVFEVTAHANARPSHRSWQGQVFTKRQLISVCGLGSVDGLEGANCRHNHMAFIPGISVRTYTAEQLRAMTEKEDTTFVWHGKEYKGYEAAQQQRHMETVMRKQRSDVRLLQQGKADSDEVMAAKSRYLNTLHQYQGFSKRAKLPEQMERVYMDGLGKVINNSKQVTNSSKSGIIKTYRSKMAAGKYPTSDATIKNVLSNELSGVKMLSTPQYNGRIRSQGITKYQEYPWGEFKKITGIEISKQVKNTRECLIDTILHEQLEAKIVSLKDENDFYRKLYSCSEEERHIYINRVIKRFFKGKGWNYGLV